ncbi:MAG: NTP transferase domain-containing protein [Bacteroidia bacterium]|nr:NTP transferase domain-containing protein [Bacteroidia bacterium]
MKAMILAAGLGTRLKPFTDKHPKALAEINGKTLLQHNIEYLISYGISEIIINVHHFAEQVYDKVNKYKGWGANITISDETNELLETGGGLKKAAWFFDDKEEPFVLLNVDILTDVDILKMYKFHIDNKTLATLFVSKRDTSRYLLFDDKKVLSGWKNNKTGQIIITRQANEYLEMAFNGLHIISKEFLSLIKQNGKFSIIDTYLDLSINHKIQGYEDSNARMIDVGKPESISKAEKIFK